MWLRVVLVASLMVPGAVLSVTAWESRQRTLEAADRQIAITVSLLREQMARVLQSDEIALELIDQSIAGMTWDEIAQSAAVRARLATLLRQLPQIAAIGLVNPEGVAVASNLTNPFQPINVSDRDYFVTLRDHPEAGTFISRATVGRLTHLLRFSVARRRRTADGHFDGVMVLGMDPSYVSAFYASFAGPDGMAILLARTDGAVLARYPPATGRGGLMQADLTPDSPLVRAAASGPGGNLSGRSSIDGVVRVSAYARVAGYPLLISYGVSRAGVLAPWSADMWVYGPLTVAASVALALVTWCAMRGAAEVAGTKQGLEIANAELAHQIAERTRAEVELIELNGAMEQRISARTASLLALSEQLERERVRMASFIEASPFANLLVNERGAIVMMNVAAEQLFGYRREELVDRPVETLVPARIRDVHPGLRDSFFTQAISRPMGAGLDVLAVRKDGREVPVEILLSPQQTPTGQVTVVGVSDISARREAQLALLSVNADLVMANQELTQANTTVRLKSEEVETFVYIVSHDLRAPLINLQGFARELERGCAELREILSGIDLPEPVGARVAELMAEDINGSLPYIIASVAKFDRLINALIDLSRTGRYPLHPVRVNVAEVLQSTLDTLRGPIEAAGAIVIVDALPPAVADTTALGQIFANLIMNSMKFVAAGCTPQIEIGGEVVGDVATFWVRDNGRGIPIHARTRLFQMFQRFHPGVAEGDGIGLATVKHLVERLGGTVRVEDAPGGGSIFIFTLPGARSPVERSPTAQTPGERSPGERSPGEQSPGEQSPGGGMSADGISAERLEEPA
jgi:PAS domain S-box-containing protein